MEIKDETVLRVARLAIGDPNADVREWSGRALGGGATGEVGTTGGVHRISGIALSNDREIAWSVILKILHQSRIQLDADTEVQTSDPRGWAYWRREADVYRSGILGDLDGLDGLVAPRCFGSDEILPSWTSAPSLPARRRNCVHAAEFPEKSRCANNDRLGPRSPTGATVGPGACWATTRT